MADKIKDRLPVKPVFAKLRPAYLDTVGLVLEADTEGLLSCEVGFKAMPHFICTMVTWAYEPRAAWMDMACC